MRGRSQHGAWRRFPPPAACVGPRKRRASLRPVAGNTDNPAL